MNDRIPDPYSGQGLNEAAAADLDEDELDDSGGSSGSSVRQKKDQAPGAVDREMPAPAGSAHGSAAEAAALGYPEGGLAMMGQRSNAGAEPAGAENLGAGPGRKADGAGRATDRAD